MFSASSEATALEARLKGVADATKAVDEANASVQGEIDKLRFGVDASYQVDLLQEQLQLRRTSGTMHLVLFRVLAQVEVTTANIGNAIDALTGGLPRLYDNTTLQLVWIQSGATGVNLIGQYIETQG